MNVVMIAGTRLIPNLLSITETKGRRMKAARAEMIRARTRSGKNDATQKTRTIVAMRNETLTKGWLGSTVFMEMAIE